MMKDLHTHVEVLLKQKKDRKRELKALREQDKNLCDILCVSNFSIDDSAVPSLDELDRYRRHVASLSAEKVSRRGPDFWGGGGGWKVPTGSSWGSSPPGAKARRICQHQAAGHPLHGGAGAQP